MSSEVENNYVNNNSEYENNIIDRTDVKLNLVIFYKL